MTDTDIITLVKEALEEVAPGRSKEINGDGLDVSIRDLAIDSVATMEMVGCIEERLGTTFPDEELVAVNKLSDLAVMIRRSAA